MYTFVIGMMSIAVACGSLFMWAVSSYPSNRTELVINRISKVLCTVAILAVAICAILTD